MLVAKVEKDLGEHHYFQEDIASKQVLTLQKGVFRTNCLDSLDRTNVGQGKIGLFILQDQLRQSGVNLVKVYGEEANHKGLAFIYSNGKQQDSQKHDCLQDLRQMWTDMGDQLSRQYAGTDSTISKVSRDGRETFDCKVQHKTMAVKRFFLNTLSENPMQLSIDIVLGKFMGAGYCSKRAEFIAKSLANEDVQPKVDRVTIGVGSWNLSGI